MDRLRRKTTDAYSIFGREAEGAATSLAFKDQVLDGERRAKGLKNANAYRRLKLAMDYWCALWFWPIDKSHLLPDRDEYLFDLENLLLGDTLAAGRIGEQAELFAPTVLEAEGKAFVDKYGVVNLDLLFQHFPRLKLAQVIAAKRRFFHWELEYADIFAGEEFEESEGTQNFLNAAVNYPLLQGQKANLYKCFLPQAWMIGSGRCTAGFLHPEGVYDDPKGASFRAIAYPRLRGHFGYANELKLFAEVDNHTRYSVNIYGAPKIHVSFATVANLLVPNTLDHS